MKKYISYIRVSTKKQGESKLSQEAQRREIQQYISKEKGVLLAEFSEVETGTNKRQRIEIHKAIQQAKNERAILVIAKLDRLARDVSFVNTLMDSGLDFICLDLRDAGRDTIRLLATIAQNEAERIRSRIKSALDSKRERGEQMGNIPTLNKYRRKGLKRSMEIRQELARTKNETAVKQICNLRDSLRKDTKQVWTYKEIAQTLNSQNLRTTRGNEFTPKQVQLLYERYC